MNTSSAPQGVGRRLAWAAASQLASSASNFALYVGLLVASDAAGFGRWVAVLAVFHLALALARSLVAEPLVASAGAGRRPTPGGAGAASAAFSWPWARARYRVMGIGAAIGVAAVGWRVGADGPTVVAFTLAVPFLLAQDGLRSLAWALGRPDRSVLLDGAWIVTTGSLLGLGGSAGSLSPELVLSCWLIGGLASAGVGARLILRGSAAGPAGGSLSSDGPAPTPAPPESRADRGVPEARLHARRRSQALLTASRNLLPIVVAVVLGPTAAGLLKAALLPFTPMLSLMAGMRVVVLPAMQRAAQRSVRDLDRLANRIVAAQLAAAGLLALASLAVVGVLTAGLDPTTSALRPDLVRWGAVVAVTISVATPLADAMGFGRRPGPVVGRRLVEIALEWGAVFGAAWWLGGERVVAGWAAGVVVGALLWSAPILRPALRRSPAPLREEGRGRRPAAP